VTTPVVAHTIARSNRNRLLRSILGIVAVIIFAAVTYRYFYNFFLGPFPITHEELTAAAGPGDLFRYYVTVDGDDVIDTGFEMERRRNGVVTSTDNYFALVLGDRLLLVETPTIAAVRTTYTGYLESSTSEVRTRVIDDIESSEGLPGIFLPMQLTDSDFKFPGYLGIAAVAVVLGLSLWGLGTSVQRYGDSGSHPIARSLGRFGDPAMAISSLDSEMMADHPRIGDLHLTPSWLVYQKKSDLKATRFDDIVWVYKMVTTQRTNGVKTGTTYTARVWDRHGVEMILQDKEGAVNEMLNGIVQRAPWALAGHNAEIETAWKSNRPAVLAAVDQRRQQVLAMR
jgi:hypothetical protein